MPAHEFSRCSFRTHKRKMKEAYQLLLSKSQPPNPLPRKVWKQMGPHREGNAAGAHPGAGPCGSVPCSPQATKSLKSQLAEISTNLNIPT